jgi:hypothetical protein
LLQLDDLQQGDYHQGGPFRLGDLGDLWNRHPVEH